ncbi:unnamed protein product [Didymodactylos carnosus]|uniref:Eukaryotic translation initiation factor 4E binding protein n=1 Tax=Didymodactylos carnosus TaxID=1234261 RepID=A0A815JEP1_9BILA|nr:unnamed protein product [Didymodactylos carnosus]CAF4276332.1 unnamed protein product [Didymodactylos carnosus]
MSEGIPIRRLTVHDPSEMPLSYGTTPGGSIFSTTPGGTRIYYDRQFLLSRRDSPLTRSPPVNLPFIPEVTLIPNPAGSGTGTLQNGTAGSNKKIPSLSVTSLSENSKHNSSGNNNTNQPQQQQQQQQQNETKGKTDLKPKKGILI